MRTVRWSFQNLHMPMMADENNTLWCTSQQLCLALNIELDSLRSMRHHRDEFSDISVISSHAKEYLKDNKGASNQGLRDAG